MSVWRGCNSSQCPITGSATGYMCILSLDSLRSRYPVTRCRSVNSSSLHQSTIIEGKGSVMSNGPQFVGEISVKDGVQIDWTIPNIFSYTAEDVSYSSRCFEAGGSRWFLHIYPNGQAKNDTIGWTSVYINRLGSSLQSRVAVVTFGLRRADGTAETVNRDLTCLVRGGGIDYAGSKLMQRSDLQRRMSELAPSGDLTVTCSLQIHKDFDPAASMDALCRDFTDLFTSESGCDATLKVKHKEFSVHKCILSARSSVFAAMFEADMQEKRSGVVDIVDCNPEAFEEFLFYIYSGKAEDLPSNAIELYRIADKYDVAELKSQCLNYVMRNITVENVLDAAVLGRQFSEDALKVKTQTFFNENFAKIVTTAHWASFLKSNCHLANELLKFMGSEMKVGKITTKPSE